jgi:hypothetical protein
VIENRTAPWAEEEIRLVFSQVAEIAIKRWPNLFSDYTSKVDGGLSVYTTPNSKV